MDGPEALSEDASDHDLFAAVARAGAQGPARADAMRILYLRYAEEVYKYSWRFHRRLGGEPGVRDHVEEVYLRAMRAAATFRVDASLDRHGQSRATLGWLQRIALNLYIDQVRTDKGLSAALRKESYELSKEESRAARPTPDGAAEDPDLVRRRDRAVSALSLLSDRDQDILLVSLDWYCPDRHRFANVPSDVIAALCERYAIKPDNYRQIRDRAFNRMKDFLLSAA